jgi:eukaryotic-like serine/threonine-protein kinase
MIPIRAQLEPVAPRGGQGSPNSLAPRPVSGAPALVKPAAEERNPAPAAPATAPPPSPSPPAVPSVQAPPASRAEPGPSVAVRSPPPLPPTPAPPDPRLSGPRGSLPEQPERVGSTSSPGAAGDNQTGDPLESGSIARERGNCSITIGSRPWAEVWLDGRSTGKLTPLVGYKVPCGRRKIRLWNPELNLEKIESVILRAGEPYKKIFPLDDGQ